MDKISIVIATYKRYDLLQRSIDSALNQTYPDIEIIVADDNPPESEEREKTAELMRSYEERGVIYIKNEKNMGGALTRNAGMDAATGEYITFLDDDDEYLPGKVETQYTAMKKNGWDMSVMDGATYDENGELLSVKRQRLSNGMSRDELMRTNLIYHITGTNTFMYKAGKLRELHGFDDVPACHEFMLMQKTINSGMSIGYIPEILVKNHIYGGGRISTSMKKITGQTLLMNEKKKYFGLLTPKERRSVLCRHYGVLFYVYYKNRKYAKAASNALCCFFTSPGDAFRWFGEYRKKLTA